MIAPDSKTLSSVVAIATPLLKPAIDGWLKPLISEIIRSRDLKRRTKLSPEDLAKTFEEYLVRTYGKLTYMNTIVFGPQQKRIQDLYIPLTLCPSLHGATRGAITIDGWSEEFVPKYKRVVITDTAGMGKSTILKWLFLSSFGTSKSVPIFIELRTLSASKSLLERIHEELCPIGTPFDEDLLLYLLETGRFVFLLDGFDEISFEDRQTVTNDIQTFISKAFKNFFVLASRHEAALGSFGEFQEFTIKPLAKDEAFALLRKYDDSGAFADPLITDLSAGKYEQLKDMLSNPMLVSLLFKAYCYKPNVPFKKQIFYRQVFDALFDMHDSTKGGAFAREKHSKLDIDEFHLIMRDFGFTTAKLGKIEYEKDEVSDIIQTVRTRNKVTLFQPAALLKDLLTST